METINNVDMKLFLTQGEGEGEGEMTLSVPMLPRISSIPNFNFCLLIV